MAPENLQRFHTAQANAAHGYAAALAEIRSSGKRSHWIWYIFPQLEGLGSSAEARRYALSGRLEASAYLEDPLLRARLLEITTAVAQKLERGWLLPKIMGSSIDVLKLISSLTLFEQLSREVQTTAPHPELAELASVTQQVLLAAATPVVSLRDARSPADSRKTSGRNPCSAAYGRATSTSHVKMCVAQEFVQRCVRGPVARRAPRT